MEEASSVAFVARVEKGFRVRIPRNVRDVLGLEEGDYVQINIRKIRGSKKLSIKPEG